MTYLMIIPLFLFYGLAIMALGAGIAGCIGAFSSRRRRAWVLGAGIIAVGLGLGINYYYFRVVWSAAFLSPIGLGLALIVGVLPILLGGVSVIRWLQMKS